MSESSFRLSAQQERVWRQRAQGAAAAVQLWGEVAGELDGERLARSLERLAQVHEILRSRFVRQPGRRSGAQVIEEAARVACREVDGSAWPAEELEGRLAELAAAEAAVWAQEGAEPGPRLAQVALGDGRGWLLLSAPALAADAFTAGELLREALALYGGGEPENQEPLQYADYTAWQRDRLADEEDVEMVEARRFWEEAAQRSPEPAVLPPVRPVGPEGFTPRLLGDALPAEVAARLAEVAAEAGLPAEALALAAFEILLRRRSGLDGLALATLADGRVDDELRSAQGPFARWLPVRRRVGTGERFLDAARELALALAEVRRHQDGYAPPADRPGPATAFAWIEVPADLAAGTAAVRIRRLDAQDERFPVKLQMLARGRELEVALGFDAARLDPADARRLLDGYLLLLAAAVAEPETPADALPVLAPAERQWLLAELARGPEGAAAEDTVPVHRRFERQARLRPGETAVVSRGVRLTFTELDARANLLAHRLRAAGVGPDRRVGLLLDRSVEMVVALLATLKAGGAYASLEPAQPVRRLELLLAELSPAALVTQGAVADRLPAGLPFPVVRVDEADDASPSPEVRAGAPAVEVDPANLAYLVFTSGSTGVPKGVLVEHRHLARYTTAVVERLGLAEAASFAMVSTFAADLGNTCLFPALTTGGTLHVLTPEQAGDAHAFGEYCSEHRIDCLKIVPSHLDALLSGPRPERRLPARRLVLGGEACRWDVVDRVRGLAPEGLRVFNHYGPSETTVGVLTQSLDAFDRERTPARTAPIGRPLAGTQVYILDREMAPVPSWAPGEVYLGGATVTRGYLGRPDLTADRFVPDPLGGVPGARLYRTGDVGRFLGTGEVEFLGRIDHQIKYHGFRVELEEIRSALIAHPEVRDGVVMAARDGDRDVLIAYYVARQEIDVKSLRAFLAETILEETIPGYFIHLRRLPLNLNGKVHHAALPSFDEVRRRAQRHFVEPRNEAEAALAEIWADVLRLEKVSIDDNFFEIGGHSLLATRVVSRVRQRFAVDLPLRALFEVPTVAGLAAGIRDGRFPRIADAEGEEIAPAADAGDLDAQLAELDEISDEQARDLLKR